MHSKNLKKLLLKYKFSKIVPANCQDCRLGKTRTKIVPHGGNPLAKLILLGEGPGSEEDLSGKPFVGRSGKKLFKTINALGFEREDFLILNLIKCRPPNNRNPGYDEIKECRKYLYQQFELSQAKVILVLGKVAWKAMTGVYLPVTIYRGTTQEWTRLSKEFKIVYTYHPSYVLRNNTIETNKDFLSDIKSALDLAGYFRR